jgi:type IV pilus assembly protein PilV
MSHHRRGLLRGASLIEVLVSILIVSLGVVAVANLLAKSAQLGKASEYRAMAALLAADMADRIKANAAGLQAGNYDLTPAALLTAAPAAAAACANVKACTAAELAAIDLAQWQQNLYASIPGGTGYIQFDAANGGIGADLWVVWQDSAAHSSDTLDATGKAAVDAVCPADFQKLDPVPSCMFFRVGL